MTCAFDYLFNYFWLNVIVVRPLVMKRQRSPAESFNLVATHGRRQIKHWAIVAPHGRRLFNFSMLGALFSVGLGSSDRLGDPRREYQQHGNNPCERTGNRMLKATPTKNFTLYVFGLYAILVAFETSVATERTVERTHKESSAGADGKTRWVAARP